MFHLYQMGKLFTLATLLVIQQDINVIVAILFMVIIISDAVLHQEDGLVELQDVKVNLIFTHKYV